MTTTEQSNGTALATTEYPKLTALTGFSAAKINLIRQTVATGCSIVEVAWYLYNADRLGLEPTLDQIYLIKYGNNPADIVVGINGYRSQAESSGVYAGSDDPVYEYEDVGQPRGAPSKATVTVWKIVAGVRCPFTASARWEEFYPDQGRSATKAGEQYRKRPHNQLAVRAESHALRKGFPYQTARLEIREQAPDVWIEAAQQDEAQRYSPERTKALSAKYDETFPADPIETNRKPTQSKPIAQAELLEEDASAPDPPRDAESAGRGVAASPAAAPRRPEPPVDHWARNRALVQKATELGIQGIPVIGNRSTQSVLEQANSDLSERIRVHEAELVEPGEQEGED
jgi:RecT family protein